jgi:hypothetical protein
MEKGLRYNGTEKWRIKASLIQKWAGNVREDNVVDKP